MEIKTKYDYGNIIWFMKKNKVEKGKITIIETRTSSKGNGHETIISYGAGTFTADVEEKDCFLSKEELLKSL